MRRIHSGDIPASFAMARSDAPEALAARMASAVVTDERAERYLAGVDDPLTVVQTAALHSVHHSLHPAERETDGPPASPALSVGSAPSALSASIRAQLKVLEDDINEAWRAVELSRERMDVRSSPSMYAVANGCDWRAATYSWLARREVERAGLFRRLGDLHDEEVERDHDG